jgi:lipid-A-disaccharide synthase
LIFPFEPQIYEAFGGKAEYVGNPLLDEFAENQPQGLLRGQLGIAPDEQVVGIFPGSRNSEVQHILDVLVETAALISRERPAVKFLVPIAPSLSRETIAERFSTADLPVSFVEENIYEVAAACDAILTVSGTVTLQITLVETPMAILYKVAPLSYMIGRRLIKIAFAGLTNIIAGREVVREFIQDAADPAAMCCEVLRLLGDRDYIDRVKSDLGEVKSLLGTAGCSDRVADIVADMSDSSVK